MASLGHDSTPECQAHLKAYLLPPSRPCRVAAAPVSGQGYGPPVGSGRGLANTLSSSCPRPQEQSASSSLSPSPLPRCSATPCPVDPFRSTPISAHTSTTISTSVPGAQQYFDQGLRLIFGFNHAEAIRAFTRAAELDPELRHLLLGRRAAPTGRT